MKQGRPKKQIDTVKINTTVSKEVMAALEALAEREQRSISNMVMVLLGEAIDRRKER